jgi:hypothetical protein
MKHKKVLFNQATLLTERLEKLPPDSVWARRASGVRGTLLKLLPELKAAPILENHQRNCNIKNLEHIHFLIDRGYELLERAAQEY